MPRVLKHHYALPGLSIITLISLCVLLGLDTQFTQNSGSQGIRIHCAAGIKNAVEPALADFSSRTGIHVEVTYGGSGVLLSDFRTRPSGVDLFLAADNHYTQAAKDFGLVSKITPLARMQPVVAFANANPHGIHDIKDLLDGSIRVALAHPDIAAIGKCTQQALESYGYWEILSTQATVFKPTVNALANDITLNAVDAAILWDATARQYPEIDFFYAPELSSAASTVCVGIGSTTPRPKAAQLLIDDLSDPQHGGQYFETWGYAPLNQHHKTHSQKVPSP